MRRAIAYVALLTAGGLLLWIAGADLTNGPTDRVDDGRAGSPGETALPSTSDAGSPGSPTGAVIRGQVRRSGVARTARVELRRLAPADPLVEPLATTTTGPDGRFTFGGLEPGDYELRALEGEGRSVGAFPTVKHPGQHVQEDLVIPDGPYELRGIAVFRDGRPFDGLLALREGGGWSWRHSELAERRFRPGSDGSFVIRGIVSPTVRVQGIERDGARLPPRHVACPVKPGFRFVVDEGLREFHGRVVRHDDGAPIAGAEVRLDDPDRLVGRTGGDGLWRGPGLEIRSYLLVRAEGYVSRRVLVPAGENGLTIRLRTEARIAGVTVDPDGKPVGGVTLVCDRSKEQGPDTRLVNSGPDGRFLVTGLTPDLHLLRAAGPSHVSPAGPVRVGTVAGETVEIEIPVAVAASARGRVLDEEGRAVAGATVAAFERDRDEADLETATAAAGTYGLPGLVPGVVYRFEARTPDRVPARAGPVRAAASHVYEIDFRLDEGRSLDVRVVEKGTGRPIHRAEVHVISLEPGAIAPWNREWASEWSTDHGHVRVGPLPAGRLAVSATPPGHEHPTPRVLVVEPTREVLLEVASPRSVSIRARFPDGTRPTGGQVHATFTSLAPFERGSRHRWAGRSERHTLDSRGEITLARGPDVYTSVIVWTSRGEESFCGRAELEGPDQEVDLLLEPVKSSEPSITLRVAIADHRGRPLRGGEIHPFLYGPTGDYSCGELRDGVWEIRVTNPTVQVLLGLRPEASADDTIPAHRYAGPIPVSAGQVSIELAPGRTISGVAEDEDGNPIRGVVVTATHEYGHLGQRVWSTDVTDARGTFRLRGLGEMTYRVQANVSRDRIAPSPASAAAGTEGLRLVFRSTTCARIRVLDETSRPVPGATVLTTMGTRRLSLVSDANGDALLTELRPDRETKLRAYPPDGRFDLIRSESESWRPELTTLTLSARKSIHGVVRDPLGRPVGGARIYVETPDNGLDSWFFPGPAVISDPDGRFRLDDRPEPGSTLRAVAAGVPSRELGGEAVKLREGMEDLTLEVPDAAELRLRVSGVVPGTASPRIHIEIPSRSWSSSAEIGRGPLRVLLPEGEPCDIWVYSRDGKRTAHAMGVLPGGPLLTLSLVPAAAIHGKLVLPKGVRRKRVSARGPAIHQWGEIGKNGRFEIAGLPRGEWTVRVEWWVDGEEHTRDVRVATGVETTIRCE